MSPRSSSDQRRAIRCHLACWEEAYSGLVDADRLAEITGDLERAIGWWQTAPTSDRSVILAVAGDFVAGFANAGLATEPGVDVALQVNAINVPPGLPGNRCRAAAARCCDRRLRCIPLGVPRNPRDRAFYVRNGFRPDGAEQVEDFFGPLEIGMVRRRGISR